MWKSRPLVSVNSLINKNWRKQVKRVWGDIDYKAENDSFKFMKIIFVVCSSQQLQQQPPPFRWQSFHPRFHFPKTAIIDEMTFKGLLPRVISWANANFTQSRLKCNWLFYHNDDRWATSFFFYNEVISTIIILLYHYLALATTKMSWRRERGGKKKIYNSDLYKFEDTTFQVEITTLKIISEMRKTVLEKTRVYCMR